MSIADRIQAINDHLIDDYKVLRLAGADLTGVNKNIVNLKMSWKERLLYFMNYGTDEVWNNWTKVNGTGTTLSLNNTEEAPMSLIYKGNTSQSGTPTPSSPIPVQVVSGDNSIVVCGKNLVNINDNYIKRENATYSNITVSNNTLSFEITGSRSGYVGYIIPTTIGQTYTLSFNLAKGFIYTIELDNVISDISGNFGLERTTPYTYTATKQYIGVWLSGGNTTDNQASVSNLMLEHGSPASTYEEYKGASYPISLGIENLFDYDTFKDYKSSGLTLIDNGFKTTAYSNFISKNLELEKGQTYTIMFDLKKYGSQAQSGAVGTIAVRDMTNSANIGYYNSGANFTIPSNCDTTYLYLYGANPSSTTEYYEFTNIRVIKGNTPQHISTTPIELCKIGTYQDKIDKSSGSNLFNISNFTLGTSNGITATINGDHLVLNGTASSTAYVNFTASNFNGTCTWGIRSDVALGNLQIQRTGAGVVNIAPSTTWNKSTLDSTNVTGGYLSIPSGTTLTNCKVYLYVGEGTLSSIEYEPYGTGWYLKKEIGKVVLNGSEEWQLHSSSSGTNYRYWLTGVNFTNVFVNIISASESNLLGNVLCNYEEQALFSNTAYGKFGINTSSTSIAANWFLMNFDGSDISTLENLKTWLSTHNTTVYYVLSTPTYETITDTTLLSQLEALKKSYEEQTNISQVNNDLPFELSVTALEVMS